MKLYCSPMRFVSTMQRLPPILRDAVASTGIGGLLVRPRPPQGVAVVDRRPRRGLPAAAHGGAEQERGAYAGEKPEDLLISNLTVLHDVLAYIYDLPNNYLIHTI